MIRLTALLRRKPGTTHEEFLDHWFHGHGPLIAGLASAPVIQRYEQHPAVWPEPGSGLPEPKYDGVTLQWFDSIGDFIAFATAPDRHLVSADEIKFLDTANIEWILTEEPTVVFDRTECGRGPSASGGIRAERPPPV